MIQTENFLKVIQQKVILPLGKRSKGKEMESFSIFSFGKISNQYLLILSLNIMLES